MACVELRMPFYVYIEKAPFPAPELICPIRGKRGWEASDVRPLRWCLPALPAAHSQESPYPLVPLPDVVVFRCHTRYMKVLFKPEAPWPVPL